MAAILGATVEFSKWEGFTFDTKRNRIYTAMSEIREGMEDFGDKGEPSTEFDLGDSNDVRLEYNPCGCVYAMDVDADFMATNMYVLVCGNTDTNTDEFNECDVNSIAGPDNVAYVSGHDGLIIGAPPLLLGLVWRIHAVVARCTASEVCVHRSCMHGALDACAANCQGFLMQRVCLRRVCVLLSCRTAVG